MTLERQQTVNSAPFPNALPTLRRGFLPQPPARVGAATGRGRCPRTDAVSVHEAAMENPAPQPAHAAGGLWPASDAGSGAAEMVMEGGDGLLLQWPAEAAAGNDSGASSPEDTSASALRCLDASHPAGCSRRGARLPRVGGHHARTSQP